ncbi:glycosyltransferase family 39 protein [soil metagenome]
MTGGTWPDAGMKPSRLRVNLVLAGLVVLLVKLVLAARAPLFVDEAFYAWEGQRLAWAYSDLPAATAWIARAGLVFGGLLGVAPTLALRIPFLLLGTLVPWLAWRIAARAFGPTHADQTGWVVLLMPLSGLLGVLALPDVPLVVAGLICVDAWLRLRERVDVAALGLLAAGLVLGALSHYRFAAMLIAAVSGMALDRRSWPLLRDRRVLVVLLLGALGWLPLLLWNLQHAGAGLAFQLRDRNPWRFDGAGLAWLPIQFLLVTPPLFLLLLATLRKAWHQRRDSARPWGLLAGITLLAVPALFVLGFFADRQRVSFHWPLFGWIVLACAAPAVLSQWPRWARALTWSTTALGLLLALAFLSVAGAPAPRAALAASRIYPADFSGATELQDWVRSQPAAPGTTWIGGDFGTAAQLAFALRRDDIRVLDDPLNRKHGRAAQLRVWGLEASPDWLRATASGQGGPVQLLVEDSATPMKARLALYHQRCAQFGALPVPQSLSVDHGRKRYFRYRFDAEPVPGPCASPALAWIDAPAAGTQVSGRVKIQGWAFKDGVGLDAVDVLIDNRVVGRAQYGLPMPGVQDYWRVSTDPNQPKVGLRADIDTKGLAPGRHWLGLRLHGSDGSVEAWPEQAIDVSR